MSDTTYNFTFIGRSGCGKGTQANLLKKHLENKYGEGSVLYANTGTFLRELSGQAEFLSARLLQEKILTPGEKAPDFLSLWALTNELIHGISENNHLIIDGSPRTVIEIHVLDEMFDFFDRKKVFHIFLNTSAEWVSERMISRGRADDNEENIKRRMAYFEKLVEPAIDFFKKETRHKFIEINGEQSIEKVQEDLLKALEL